MKVLEELVKTGHTDVETVDGALRVEAILSARRDSPVYLGHFPGKAVTPGVLMLQAVVELLERASGMTLCLKKVVNVKYLEMMEPDDIDGATLTATLVADGVANATYTKAGKTYAKIKVQVVEM